MSYSVTSNRRETSYNNSANAFDFVIRSVIKGLVNTAIPVMIQEVLPGDEKAAGYVRALPLVMFRDPENNSIPNSVIPRLPFFRYYAGRAAIVCDPVPGDIGLAVFAQQDSSLVNAKTTEPQPAGSFRNYDMSDGFYIGGFYKGAGDTNIIFDQQGNITINAPSAQTINTEAATVNCKTSTINATEKMTVNSPETEFTGNVTIDQGLTIVGDTVSNSGDVTASGISLRSHTHTNVEPGDGSSGGPQ